MQSVVPLLGQEGDLAEDVPLFEHGHRYPSPFRLLDDLNLSFQDDGDCPVGLSAFQKDQLAVLVLDGSAEVHG